MEVSKYNGQRVLFTGGHPWAGRTGVIIGRDSTPCGDCWVVQIDGDAQRCFFSAATEVVFLKGEKE